MANRTMQAKTLKLQRQLRRMPRSMNEDVPGKFEKWSNTPIPARLLAEGVQAGRRPNQELMDGYKHRAKSLSMPDVKARFVGVTPARRLAIAKVEALATEDEIISEGRSFTILDTRVHRARVFFNAGKTLWVIVYENFRECIVRRSMSYGDKLHLIDDFRSKSRRLVWVETRLSNHTEGG